MEALGISLSTLAKQAHQAQCSSCDPSDGKTTPLADGTNCFYLSDTSSVEMMEQFISAGQCQSGSCTTDRPCDLVEEMLEFFDWGKVAEALNYTQCRTCDLEQKPLPDGVWCNLFDSGTSYTSDGNCVNGFCVAFDPDTFYKSCTSYTNCDSGEYCQFFEETIPTDPKPEKGYCLPLSNWKENTTFQKFTSYRSQAASNSDWWTALDVCSAMGKRLATWEEFGCDVNSTSCVGLAETWYQTDGIMVESYVYKSASDQTGGFFVRGGYSAILYDHAYIPGERGDKVPGLICADK
jgi:hypothetical protein